MYKELDEQTLARYCSQRDRMAEDELYRRYAARVYTLCRRYVRDDDDAKDLMVETIIQALDRIETYKFTGAGSLYGWIHRIAINKAINLIKRHKWRMVSLDFRANDNIPEPTEDEMAEIPSERLREWISELPEMRRTVFNLYCLDGYSHKEIGSMLGIGETTSSSVLAKAKKQLKAKIQHYLKEQDK